MFSKKACEGGDPVSTAKSLGFSEFFFTAHMCLGWEELIHDRCHVVHINAHMEKTHRWGDIHTHLRMCRGKTNNQKTFNYYKILLVPQSLYCFCKFINSIFCLLKKNTINYTEKIVSKLSCCFR